MNNFGIGRERSSFVGVLVAAMAAAPSFAQPAISGPPTVVATAGQRLVASDPTTQIFEFVSLASDGVRVAANVTTVEGGAVASFTPGSATVQTRLRVGAGKPAVAGHNLLKLEHGFNIGASGALAASVLTSDGRPDATSDVFGLLDSLWLVPNSGPSSLVAFRGNKFSFNGDGNSYRWTFTSHPGVTDGGTPYWIGGYTGDIAAPTSKVALFRVGGANLVRLIGSASGVVGGLNLDNRRPLRIAFLTPSGSRIYGVFGLAAAQGITQANDEIVGWREAETPSTLVRVLFREGAFVSGNAGEKWRAFDAMAATDKNACPGTNEWALLARTNADSSRDSVLVVNGQIVLREGATVDGRELLGDPKALVMNRQGDWAVLWRVREVSPLSSGGWLDRNAILVNGRTALVEQAAAVGGASVASLDGPICIGDRAMSGYVDVGVIGTILPGVPFPARTAALLNVHAISGLAGCCPADIATGEGTVEGETPDGKITLADLQLFITRYLASDARADLDNGSGTGVHDGLFTEADVTYYLNHYFAGCLEGI